MRPMRLLYAPLPFVTDHPLLYRSRAARQSLARLRRVRTYVHLKIAPHVVFDE